MKTQQEIEDYLLNFENVNKSYPFGEGLAVFKNGSDESSKIFALVEEGTNPLRIELKCDPLLAVKLREEYETVLQSQHFSKKYWNEIILTGQLPDDELKSLFITAYNLAKD